MAKFCFSTRCLLLSFAAFLLASDSDLIEAVPQSPRAAGVFLLIEGETYTFNFTAARAACLILNVTMATRAQMERALRRGLETCKFGWIAEQIGVIPRLTAKQNCGNGKTGLATWSAEANKKFGVFCFNASEGTPNSSPTTLTQTSTPATTPLSSATKAPPSMKPVTTKVAKQKSFTSAVTLLIKTTHSTSISSTSSPTLKPFSTHIPTSLSPLITSKPIALGFVFSTSAHASSFSLSSESQPTSSSKPSLGTLPTALIVLGLVALLLAAAGVVWCYKLHIFPFRSPPPQKDDVETEMRKHAGSELDLHREGEEADRKYSSDVTLCVNPDFKTNSSE